MQEGQVDTLCIFVGMGSGIRKKRGNTQRELVRGVIYLFLKDPKHSPIWRYHMNLFQWILHYAITWVTSREEDNERKVEIDGLSLWPHLLFNCTDLTSNWPQRIWNSPKTQSSHYPEGTLSQALCIFLIQKHGNYNGVRKMYMPQCFFFFLIIILYKNNNDVIILTRNPV